MPVAFPDFSAHRGSGVPPAFECTIHADDVGPVWVRLAGELDIAHAPRLDRALSLTEVRGVVILDLRGLSFVDSAGVHVIVDASTRARQTHRWFSVIRGCPQVDRMLTMSGASAVLNIVDLELPR